MHSDDNCDLLLKDLEISRVNNVIKLSFLLLLDCWDFLDTVDGLSVPVQGEVRDASAAERDRAFLEESGFPSK